MTENPISILVSAPLNPRVRDQLAGRFDVLMIDPGGPLGLSAEKAAQVRGAAVLGSFAKAWFAELPNLEIIANFGVGYDGLDVDTAAKRGIVVTNTPDVLNDEVADTTIALLINTVRQFHAAETWLRDGKWPTQGPFALSPLSLRGRHVGLYGLGRIGLEIARRLEPFKVKISYHTRSPRTDVSYSHYASLLDMARDVDTLISIVPKTKATHKTVNADVLKALGSDGVLISVGRGWTIDEDALVSALESKTIAGAGLDVFYDEPNVPDALMGFQTVSLLPHVASASVPTRNAMADLVASNLISWFERGEALTPVPETPVPTKR